MALAALVPQPPPALPSLRAAGQPSSGNSSKVWQGGGEETVHSSVVAPSHAGSAPSLPRLRGDCAGAVNLNAQQLERSVDM